MKGKSKYILSYTLALLVTIVLLISPQRAYAGQNENIVKALSSKIIPIKTVKAENGFEDLNKLIPILKNKTIISMGEASHGASEFFQMKHRMFEFLVEKMGYRLFGIEASFGDCQRVNEYILKGIGTPEKVVKGMGFWTWDTEEVVDMVKWMKRYNDNPKHITKIKFYGFDMQASSECRRKVLDYMKRIGDNYFDKGKYDLGKLELYSDFNMFYADKKVKIEIINKVNDLIKYFNSNKKTFVAMSSPSEYELIYHDLIVIKQYVDLCEKDDEILRDNYMAQNVKWILDYEKQFGNNKIMLWAHNSHVSVDSGGLKMGSFLRKMYKEKIYVVGFQFYSGSVMARDAETLELKNYNVTAPPKEYYFLNMMNRLQEPISFIDFKTSNLNKDLASLFKSEQYLHSIGSQYTEKGFDNYFRKGVPSQLYDGLIYIKKITASKICKDYEQNVLELPKVNLKDKIISLNKAEIDKNIRNINTYIKDKKVVMLGDGAEGSKEFIELKAVLSENLIKDLGFRVVALDIGFGEAEAVNNFILHDSGDINKIIKSLDKWGYRSEEMLKFIKTLKEYNKNNKTKVKIYGYNIEETKGSADILSSFLNKCDKARGDEFKKLYEPLKNNNIYDCYIIESEEGSYLKEIDSFIDNFKKLKGVYTKSVSLEEYEKAYHALLSIEESVEYNKSDFNIDILSGSKAENLKWIRSFENNENMIVWSNNLDTAKNSEDYITLGRYLKEEFGNSLYSIAFDFYEGNIIAESGSMQLEIAQVKRVNRTIPSEKINVKTTGNNYIANKLADCLENTYFLDINSTSNDSDINNWLSTDQSIHSIETVAYDFQSIHDKINPSEAYDALIFVKDITSITPLK